LPLTLPVFFSFTATATPDIHTLSLHDALPILSVRDVAPGAIAAAVIWQLMQSFGVVYVGHVVQHASATNGLFALVLGLVAFLYLDRKSTRLNSSHQIISYAVFCLKKKTTTKKI